MDLAALAVIGILFLPVSLEGAYDQGRPALTASVGPVKRDLLALRRERKRQAAKDPRPAARRRWARIPAPVRKMLLKSGARSLRGLLPYVRVDRVRIDYTAGGRDLYAAAMAYGRAGAAMEALAARLPEAQLHVRPALSGGPGELVCGARLRLRMGNLLEAAAAFGTDLLRQYFPYRRSQKRSARREG